MKKCTLCIDQIYNENLARADRVPACVATCPTKARHFGDFADPEFGRLAARARARRLRSDARDGLSARPANICLRDRAKRAPRGASRRAERGRAITPADSCAGSTARFPADKGAAMHPAYSVIVFTTASGAGYGLLALARVFGDRRRACRRRPGSGSRRSGGGGALVAAGLASRPSISGGRSGRSARVHRSGARPGSLARALRRSRLSPPLGLFGDRLGVLQRRRRHFRLDGGGVRALALLTVACTAMIYASLKPIRQWHNGFVLPAYLALGLYSGSLLLVLLTRMLRRLPAGFALLAGVLLGVAWAIKWGYWRHIDAAPARSMLGAVTGLEPIRPGAAARSAAYGSEFHHARDGLRDRARACPQIARIVRVALFLAPLALLGVVAARPPIPAQSAALLAVLSAALGVAVERWLFFAEARHVSMLFIRPCRMSDASGPLRFPFPGRGGRAPRRRPSEHHLAANQRQRAGEHRPQHPVGHL